MSQLILFRYLKFYLLHETHPSPLLFFTLFIIKQLIPNITQYFQILYFFALFLTLVKNFNMLYILPLWIYAQKDYLSLFFLLISALSCTKRWKVYLFLFTLAETFMTLRGQTTKFIWVLPGTMCLVVYKNLIFQTSQENIYYFIGFFISCILNLSLTLANSLNTTLKLYSIILIASTSTLLSHRIIANKLAKIRSMEIQHIKDPAVMACFIDLQLEDLKQKAVLLTKLSEHSKKCKIPKCYCKTNKDSKQFYVREMFQHFMKNLGSLGDERLWEYYIDYYLNKDQFVIPFYNLLRWKPNSYFSLISKLKTQAKISNFFQKANQKIPYCKQYIYGLFYDKKCQYLSLQIHQILKLKMHFWKEVAKPSLNLNQLQNLGLNILSRMQKLNYFYDHTIKQYERYLYCFDFTILYAIYLIFSTNFKEYADSLIKNIAKLLEKGTINQNNTSSTFVIKAVVQNSKKSLTKKCTRSFKNQKEISTLLKLQQMYQNQFKLIIDTVSNGFCKMVNIPKNQLIGSQLNSLIPNCYKEIHNVRLTQILDFNSDVVKELLPSKVLHSKLVLLFKGANDEIFAGLICIKYNMDIKEGVSFLSVIKRPTQNKCIALTNLSGVLMQKQRGFPVEIIKHQEVKRYLSRLKNIWFNSRILEEQKFTLSINRISYEFTIGSPYAFFLYDKECLSNNQPPIHIQLLDEESVKRRYTQQIQGYNHVRQQITKIQKIINEQKQTSKNSSIKSQNSNKSNYTINTISNYRQNNSVPVYKYILLTFSLVIACNLVLNLIISLNQVLPWNNVSQVNNPIVDNANLYNIQILQSKAVLNMQDQTYYQKYKNVLNTSRMSSFYSGKTFPQQIVLIFQNITQQLWTSMGNLWINYSTLLWPNIQKRFKQPIQINVLTKGINNSNSSTQTFTYGELVQDFAVDNLLIFYQNKYEGLLFPSLLSQVQNQTYNLVQFSNIISENFSEAYAAQLVYGLVFMALIAIFIIPMYLILRMRFKAHQKVFDLLSSIDCESISNQIQSLLYISNILNNYKEYQQRFNDYQLNQSTTFLLRIDTQSSDDSEPSLYQKIIIGTQNNKELKSRHSVSITLNSSKNANKLNTENILFKYLKYNGWQKDETSQLFRNIKYEIYEQTAKLAQVKGRKRSGELDLNRSQYDQRKPFTYEHCKIYCLLLSFVPFILSSMLINFQYITYSQKAGLQICNSYKEIYQFNTKFYQLKTYLWEGQNSFKNNYNITNQFTILQMLVSSLNYTFNANTNVFSSSLNIDAKFSKLRTLQKLIQSDIISTLDDLVQFRYNIQSNSQLRSNQTVSNYSWPHSFYQQIFYLQSLNNQREYLTKSIANYIKENMIAYCIQSRFKKMIILMVLLSWSLVSFTIGLFLIYKMKRKYFEQVSILTFLNDQMLSKNKRVESYLDNLSKSTFN